MPRNTNLTTIERLQEIVGRYNWRWGIKAKSTGQPLVNDEPRNMTEIARHVFGNDGTAINRHSVRYYLLECGLIVSLDKTLDGIPPFYTCGVVKADYVGVVPTLHVDKQQYWGDNLSWTKAERKLVESLGVEKLPEADFFSKWGFQKDELSMLQDWRDRHTD